MNQIKLAHGSGGTLSRDLISETILAHFGSEHLKNLPDSARIEIPAGHLAFTTDSYVVDPLFFPGGDIGKLAVFGTVNDLAVSGSTPRFLSCALILEAGLREEELERILRSMSEAARTAGVEVVTGDTKVVPFGKGDKIFINTSGLGVSNEFPSCSGAPALREGDRIIVTGPLGDHGAAIMACREGINLSTSIRSDCAPVTEAARCIFEKAARVPFMRDITRGGLATVLNEAIAGSKMSVVVEERDMPVREEVESISELLGIDPWYLACEGRIAAVVDQESAPGVMDGLARVPGAAESAVIGELSTEYAGKVVARTPFGTGRLVQPLSGEQLPRIC